MAISAQVRTFQLEIADMERHVYETVELRVAQHPSETDAYLVARVLAYACELEEGLAFSSGLYVSDEPALWVKDLTGALRATIEIGTPDAARLHKASKASDRVAVYCHRDPGPWLRSLGSATVHGSDAIVMKAFDRRGLADLVERLDRRNAWAVSRMEGTLYIAIGDDSVEVALEPLAWPG